MCFYIKLKDILYVEIIVFVSYLIRRPIKAALAAVAEHLSGLVPLHLVYSHGHETAIEVCYM